MKGSQLIPYVLPQVVFAAGGRFSQALNVIPKTVMGRLAHLAGITWEVQITPTFTTAPDVIGLNRVVADLKIHDGRNLRFDGNFNYLRMFETLENGRLVQPDPDTNSGSGNLFCFGRTWTPGPLGFAGAPSDFVIPAGALENGRIDYTFGALADISADTTAANVVITCTAWLLLLDEVRVPPMVERQAWAANASDINLTGRALYPFLGVLNSANCDAIASGDFGAFTLLTGSGEVVSGVDAEVLCKAYQAQMLSGQFTPVQGEPRAATDDNGKVLNGGTPTALVSATAALQPVLWSTPNAQISKIVARVESALRLRWNGAQASGVVLATRILEQPPTAVATVATAALGRLGMGFKGAKVKTLSKQPYGGPIPEFMPYKVAA